MENNKIKVIVYAPAFADHSHIHPDGSVVMDKGSTLNDLFKLIKLPLPLRFSAFCSVNYEKARWGTTLKDGDTVSFLVSFSGG